MAPSLILDREVARFDAQLVSRFHLLHDEDGRARAGARGGGTEVNDGGARRVRRRWSSLNSETRRLIHQSIDELHVGSSQS